MEESNSLGLFVDSSALVAVANRADSCHKEGERLWSKARETERRLIVTNLVVGEVISVLSMRVGKKLAITIGDLLFKESLIEIIYVDQEATEYAYQRYFKKRKSKNIGFTDCVSFAVIELHQIPLVFSFDKHFRFPNAPFRLWE